MQGGNIVLWYFCTLTYFKVLHCTLPYFIVLRGTLPYFKVLYCTLMYFTVLCSTFMYFIVLYCTLKYFNVLYWTSLYFKVLKTIKVLLIPGLERFHYISNNSTILAAISQHFSSVCSRCCSHPPLFNCIS